MPDTRVSKAKFKNFVFYSKWMFIAIAAVTLLVTDIIYTGTRYTPPDEREVSIQIVTGYVNTDDGLLRVAENALMAGIEFDPTLEAVTFQNIGYDPDNDTDGYGYQKYYVMLGVGEGDIYMVPKAIMNSLVRQGYVLPLEGYIEQGVINVGDMDLEPVTFHESEELENYDPEAMHVYAIPTDGLNAMMEDDIGMNNHGFYLVLMGFSGNPDTSAFVMNNIMEQLTAPEPEWYANYMEALAAETEETTGDVFEEALDEAGY